MEKEIVKKLDLEQVIKKVVNSDDYKALTIQKLAEKILSLNTEYSLNDIYKEIVKLENNYDLIRNRYDKLQSLANLGLVKGTITIKEHGYGFVDVVDSLEDLYIHRRNVNGAINKDLVLVRIVNRKDNEGVVERVLEHSIDLIIGTINYRRGKLVVIPDDKSLNFLISISKKNALNVQKGHKVICYITEVNNDNGFRVSGKIKNIIGHENDPDIDLLSVIYKNGFDPIFDEKVLKEARSYSEDDIVLNNRVDLRDKTFITIDGKDSKDLDDAIYLEKKNNSYHLYVSIADVSFYVKENSDLDKEAYNRATSVYLVDKVVPMLPHELSNGLCSLNPNVDRYCMTCQIEFDLKGNIKNSKVYESLINSKHRLNYDDVNKYFDNDSKIVKKYEKFSQMLDNMLNLSELINNEKLKRGMIEFEIDEPKIVVKNGKVVDIYIRKRAKAERLIEDFMIVANECVAKIIAQKKLPFIYRVHDLPSKERLVEFLKFMSVFNIKYNGDINDINPKSIQDIVNQLHDKELSFLDTLLLRVMAKAKYDTHNVGHFGLASTFYTHFTSPIRRYPDLIVHRLLKKYLVEKEEFNQKKLLSKLDKAALQCSNKEKDAINAEREVNAMKMAEYMSNYIEEEFEVRISSITSFGMFCKLDNGVEGLVHISKLANYYLDSEYHCLRNETTKHVYEIGGKILIRVVNVNLKTNDIDFEIVNRGE